MKSKKELKINTIYCVTCLPKRIPALAISWGNSLCPKHFKQSQIGSTVLVEHLKALDKTPLQPPMIVPKPSLFERIMVVYDKLVARLGNLIFESEV